MLLALTLAGSVIFLCAVAGCWGAMGERVVLDARTAMMRALPAARPVPGDAPSARAGELVTRVTSDTVLLSEAASSSLVGIINSP